MNKSVEAIKENDKLTITIVADNYYDTVRPDPAIGTRYRSAFNRSIHAEHGLSYFIETVINGTTSTFMFDFGLDPIGVLNNMKLLGIDIADANAIGLSHGHYDHWGGLVEILRKNLSKIKKKIPLYVGNEAFEHRFSQRPGDTKPHDIGQLKRDEIEGLGIIKIVEVNECTEVIPGCYFSGYIDKVTDYEAIPPSLLIERKGALVQDDFNGEQAIVFNVKERGLVVLSGCAHVGIVNTIRHAQKITGIKKLHMIIGGFHLINAKTEIIMKTVADIKAMEPDYIVPTHCTGFEAIATFYREMPKQFILNTVGTKYVITAKKTQI